LAISARQQGRSQPVDTQRRLLVKRQVLMPEQPLWRVDLAVEASCEIVVRADRREKGSPRLGVSKLHEQLLLALARSCSCYRTLYVADAGAMGDDTAIDIVVARDHKDALVEGAPAGLGEFAQPV
jgi:hypothetical protein